MKKIFLITFVLYCALANAQKSEIRKTRFDDGKLETKQHYANNKREGKYEQYYNSGKLRIEANYVDGKENGIEKQYTENGKLKYEIPYEDGKKNGVQKLFYPSGNLSIECTYVNDLQNGSEKSYSENGKLEYETTFVDGKKNGFKKVYNSNGTLNTEIIYMNDLKNGTQKGYFENGKLDYESPYVDGKRNGTEKYYFENGKIKTETFYVDGKANGVYKQYFENGKLQFDAVYVNDEKNGLLREYFETGELKSETNYLNDIKSGIGKEYEKNGTVTGNTNFDKQVKDLSYTNGDRYKGQATNNLPEGFGEYWHTDYTVKSDVPHYAWSNQNDINNDDSKTYINGIWKAGAINGDLYKKVTISKNIEIAFDGGLNIDGSYISRYEYKLFKIETIKEWKGSAVNGQMQGPGEYNAFSKYGKNKINYVGNFKDGKYDGDGTLIITYSTNTNKVCKGKFINGEFVNESGIRVKIDETIEYDYSSLEESKEAKAGNYNRQRETANTFQEEKRNNVPESISSKLNKLGQTFLDKTPASNSNTSSPSYGAGTGDAKAPAIIYKTVGGSSDIIRTSKP